MIKYINQEKRQEKANLSQRPQRTQRDTEWGRVCVLWIVVCDLLPERQLKGQEVCSHAVCRYLFVMCVITVTRRRAYLLGAVSQN